MKIGANDISAVKIGATDVNKVYLGSNLVWEKAGATLLLDLYPNAAAAYSLRKLRTAYVGSAIRVRRSSDNTEQDIGFVDNELDTASLLAFVGSGDGFVTKRYDQSGNGYDLEQTAESAQFKIVNAGALYTFNGKPYFLTDGINDVMRTTTNPIFGTDPRSLFFVQKTNVAGITGRFNLAADTGLQGRSWLITPEVAARTNSTTWVSSTPTSITSPSLISNIYTSGNLHAGNSMWLDGVSVVRTSGNDGTIDTIDSNMTEGANSTANFYDGYISESIIYQSDQSANRAGIETNINTHYNIYWDGSQTGLLDDYPNASAAYSLRALNSAYTGAAIKVRRSSDNKEQDINLLYDGTLHIASLLSFVGAGDGFVTTWYDQSGLGNDISNASAGSQAKIVNAGSVVTLNSKPAFNSEGITTFNLSLSNTQLWTGNKSYSIFSAFRSSGVVSTQHLSSYVSGNPDTYRLAMLGGNNLRLQSYDNSGGSNLNSATISINTNFVVSIFRTQSTAQSFTNSVGGTEITGINPPSSPTVTSDFFYGGLVSSFVFQGLSAEFIIYALDQTSNRVGIETNINSNYKIYWDGSQTGLLDDYPNASAAYSLRALNSAYTGAAIRVRRSSDNEEQDINLLYDGSLNTDSLLAFVGAGDGFVTTWYDQSGGGNDATQTTASNQPKIVSSGSVILDNGKPAVQFDGSNDNLPNGAGTTLPSDVSAFAVRSLSSYPTTYRSMFNYKTYGLTHNSNGGASYGLAHIFSNETAVKSIDYPTTTGQALDFLYNKSNLERNNFISTLSSGGVYGTGVSGIGSWSGTSQCFLGNIQELVIYEINQNTNKSGIKSNINSHYNIY